MNFNKKPPDKSQPIVLPTISPSDTWILVKVVPGSNPPQLQLMSSKDWGPWEVAVALSQLLPTALKEFHDLCESSIQSPHGVSLPPPPKG